VPIPKSGAMSIGGAFSLPTEAIRCPYRLCRPFVPQRRDWEIRLELGRVSAVDYRGQTIFVADVHRADGKRFVVHAHEKLTVLSFHAAERPCNMFAFCQKSCQ
jgi:hypothetical protein